MIPVWIKADGFRSIESAFGFGPLPFPVQVKQTTAVQRLLMQIITTNLFLHFAKSTLLRQAGDCISHDLYNTVSRFIQIPEVLNYNAFSLHDKALTFSPFPVASYHFDCTLHSF